MDFLIQRGIADPERLGLFGYSYGGYLSAWTMTQTQRFKAAVCGAGLSNLVSFSGTSDISQTFLPGFFGVRYWEDPSLYLERSPVMFIQHAKTPTLIQCGSEDIRVPVGQGYELYNGLLSRNIPVELLIYPGQGHIFSSPRMLKESLQDSLDWFTQWLGREPPILPGG